MHIVRITPLPLEETGGANDHSAFITFMAHGVKPFASSPSPLAQSVECSMFIMQNRNDGMVGFFGGAVDPNEAFRTTVCREYKEETGIIVKPEALMPISSHLCENDDGKTRSMHLYGVETDFKSLKEHLIRIIEFSMGDDFWESHGAFMVPTVCFPGYNKALPSVMGRPMPDGCGEQILSLLEYYDMVPPVQLSYLQQVLNDRRPIPPCP